MNFTKKLRYSSNTTALIFIVLGFLVVINYLSLRHFVRLDLTEGHQYTVSAVTKKTVANLDDYLTIKLYFTKQLPPQFIPLAESVRDMVDEYKAYSNGNVMIEYLDPADDDTILNEARSLGIQEVKMNVIEKDKYQVQNGFLGIALLYADKQEVIPLVRDVSNLESDLTTAIKKITSPTLKHVAFVSGHKEHGIFGQARSPNNAGDLNDYIRLAQELQKTYNLSQVSLDDSSSLDSVDTLIVAGPKENFSEYELFLMDQFLMKGKNLILLVDAVHILPGLQAAPLDLNIYPFLQHLGVSISPSLLIDSVHESVSFSQGMFSFMLPYPFWIKSIRENLSPDNAIVSALDSLIFTWSSPLELNPKDGVDYDVLAKTTKKAAEQKAPFNLDPNQRFNVPEAKQFNLAILLRGSFESYFKGRPTPNKPVADGEDSESISVEDVSAGRIDDAESEGVVVIVGDSDFVNDSTVSRFSQNLVFIQNVVDFLTLDKDLIDIRSKKVTDRPLIELTESHKLLAKSLGILLAPVILIIFGTTRIIMRKKKRRRL